jgi:hypothetical protein
MDTTLVDLVLGGTVKLGKNSFRVNPKANNLFDKDMSPIRLKL